MRRGVTVAVLSAAVAAVLACVGPMQAHATADSTLSLGASPIVPGGSITITADYTVNATGDAPAVVGIDISRAAGATGTIAISYADFSITGSLGGCVVVGSPPLHGGVGLGPECLWLSPVPGDTASITVTATASGDATGQWNVETFQQSPSNVRSSAGAVASFVVSPDATTPPTTPPAVGTDAALSLGASPIAPAGSITITANYTVNATGEPPSAVGIDISRAAGATGTIAISYADFTVTGSIGGCTVIGSPPLHGGVGLAPECLWLSPAPGDTASITVTATASGDATGQWNVEAFQRSPHNPGALSAGAVASFVVAPVEAATISAPSGVAAVTPAAAPSVPPRALPATGSRRAATTLELSAGFVATGALLIAIGRRRPNRA